MSKVRTHYDNLKVSRSATQKEIEGAYAKLISEPRLSEFLEDPELREESSRIQKIIDRAHEVLSDPVKRAAHDRWIIQQESDTSAKISDVDDQPDILTPPIATRELNWLEEIEVAVPFLPASVTVPVVVLCLFGLMFAAGLLATSFGADWLRDITNHYLPKPIAGLIKIIILIAAIFFYIASLGLAILASERAAKALNMK